MSTARLRVFAGAYRDSLLLLSATRSMRAADGVQWATALMATEANVTDLGSAGFGVARLPGANVAIVSVPGQLAAAGRGSASGSPGPGRPARTRPYMRGRRRRPLFKDRHPYRPKSCYPPLTASG